MSDHAYPASAMVADYLRAAAGLVPATALLSAVPVGAVAGTVLGGFAAIFAVFGLRTVLRHRTRLALTETELRAEGAVRTVIPWAELDRMRLAYYSTRRDTRAGWMQLELGARRSRLRLDSRIAGFEQLVERAALEAAARGLQLTPTTCANLEAMGLRPQNRTSGEGR